MEADFEWHDDYVIGVEEIDTQHKRLLALMKRTYELRGEAIDNPQVGHLLDELVRYAGLHFECEEAFMTTYDYPNLLEQRHVHEEVTKELLVRVGRIRRKEEQLPALLFFLIKWFVDHCNYHDKDLGEFIVKNRARA